MATTAIPSETSPRTATWPRTLLLVGRVVLGSIFLISAYTKLHFNGSWHFGDYHFFFAMAVDSYNMLPLWAVEIVARVLPILEALLGAFLVVGCGPALGGLDHQRVDSCFHWRHGARFDFAHSDQVRLLR